MSSGYLPARRHARQHIAAAKLSADDIERLERWFPRAARLAMYDFGELVFFRDDPVGKVLAALPLWTDARDVGHQLRLDDLIADFDNRGRVACAVRPLTDPVRRRYPVAVLRHRRDRKWLKRLFGRVDRIKPRGWTRPRQASVDPAPDRWRDDKRGSWRDGPGA